ncbi:MAG: VOC family protein, partial [Myxococcota bacterium]
AQDAKASEHFYTELLGMKLSDRIDMEVAPNFSIETSFFHANARHHTLAFAQVELPKKMHHFMIEAREMDAVGRGYDRVRDAGIRIMSALGRHSNDQMFSFYARTPSRFEVEFGWGGIEVDDSTWEVVRYDRGSLWGHRRPERPRKGA